MISLLLLFLDALTLHRYSYAGQNELFPGNGSQENAFVYPPRISQMALTFRRQSYVGPNEPTPGDQQPGNNGLAPGGQLVGYVLLIALVAFTICSMLTHDSRLDELDRYSPFETWAGDVSRGYNPATDRFFDSGPNGGPPARDA